MGYYIEMTDSNFLIKKENFDDALNALKSVFVPENMTCCDYLGGGIERPHFRWVDTNTILNSKTLKEALIEIRYVPSFDIEGDIIDVEFIREKRGDENIFFSAIVPYVENSSYLDFKGEDGARWEWCFNNGKCIQEYM